LAVITITLSYRRRNSSDCVMKAVATLALGTIGIMASTKPSHENFRTVSGNLQKKMMDAGMKQADDGSLTFALFGGVAKEMFTSQMDMRVSTYDYVICKVGVMSFNISNKDKNERKYNYSVGIFNKWIDCDQVLAKKVVDFNDKLFNNSLDQIKF